MKINITEVNFTITKNTDPNKHKNLLGYATLTFKDELGDYFTITGFTIWKSKIDDLLNVEPPGKIGFKYCLGPILKKLKKEIIKQYDFQSIPIIEEKGGDE